METIKEHYLQSIKETALTSWGSGNNLILDIATIPDCITLNEISDFLKELKHEDTRSKTPPDRSN